MGEYGNVIDGETGTAQPLEDFGAGIPRVVNEMGIFRKG